MANTPTKVEIGAFAAGEIPPPITHTFTNLLGQPIDISPFTIRQMNIVGVPDPGIVLGQNPVNFLTDGTDGTVVYQWHPNDMAVPGDYEAQIWVYLSTSPYRFASDLILYTVYDGPGEAPT